MEKTIGNYKVSLKNDLVIIYNLAGELIKGLPVNANHAVEGFNAICTRVRNAQNL